MHADAAEDEAARLDLVITGAIEHGGKLLDRDEGAERRRNVGVGSRATVEKQAPKSSLRVEIGEIARPEEPIRRQEKIERNEEAAGVKHGRLTA